MRHYLAFLLFRASSEHRYSHLSFRLCVHPSSGGGDWTTPAGTRSRAQVEYDGGPGVTGGGCATGVSLTSSALCAVVSLQTSELVGSWGALESQGISCVVSKPLTLHCCHSHGPPGAHPQPPFGNAIGLLPLRTSSHPHIPHLSFCSEQWNWTRQQVFVNEYDYHVLLIYSLEGRKYIVSPFF